MWSIKLSNMTHPPESNSHPVLETIQVTILADSIQEGQARFNPTPSSTSFNQLDGDVLPEFLKTQVARSQGLILM